MLHHFLMTGEDDPGEVLDADLTHDEAVGRILSSIVTMLWGERVGVLHYTS